MIAEVVEAQQQLQNATDPFGSLLIVAFNTAVLTAAFWAGVRLLEEEWDANHP